jgi:hypothetical protein
VQPVAAAVYQEGGVEVLVRAFRQAAQALDDLPTYFGEEHACSRTLLERVSHYQVLCSPAEQMSMRNVYKDALLVLVGRDSLKLLCRGAHVIVD